MEKSIVMILKILIVMFVWTEFNVLEFSQHEND